jgi:NAD(P)H-dependent flavin oxidoreductase YrpB (nitropropane dioxygenase family)
MSSIATRFTERLGTDIHSPRAGIAFAATADLGLAVCRGGGVGAIGVGFTPEEELRAAIRRLRLQTTTRFNINFLTIFDNVARILSPLSDRCCSSSGPRASCALEARGPKEFP